MSRCYKWRSDKLLEAGGKAALPKCLSWGAVQDRVTVQEGAFLDLEDLA